MSEENYLRILRESLEKKIELLNKIIIRNEQQRQIFTGGEQLPDELDENMDAKSRLVDQIIAIDDGFDQLFKSVQAQIEANRDQYREEIAGMQQLIRQITELSAKVESQEKRNREYALSYFSAGRAEIKQGRMGAAAATRYYQNMMNLGSVSPQFLDKKK